MPIRSIGDGPAISKTLNFWDALDPQSPIDDATDYFDDSSVSADWVEIDPDGRITLTEDASGIKIQHASAAGQRQCGILKAAPAHTTYAITVQLRQSAGVQQDYCAFGIGVAEGTDAADSLCVFGPRYEADITLSLAIWSNFSSFSSFLVSRSDASADPTLMYLRIYVDTTASTLFLLVSATGQDWSAIADPVSFASAGVSSVSYIGIMTNNEGTGDVLSVSSRMCRIDNTTDPYISVGAYAST
jgi:hypothetical protein